MKFLLKIILAALLMFVVYQSRWIFSYKYEPEYYENFYYESQYSYPQSARGISDGTLYKFVGYRLTQGENPFNINWEIPPLAKALYGYSSRFFGSPFWASLIFYFGSLLIFFKLLSKNFKNPVIPYLGVIMLVLVSHFSNQISDTMLDLPLTFAYLVNVYFLFNFLDNKKIKDLVLAGLSLGLAAAIKPPVYIPFILLAELLVVFLNQKRWKSLILMPVSVAAGYVLGYFVYFIRHPNPIPWLKLHEKIYSFYIGPNLTVNKLAALKELFNTGTWGYIYIAGLISFIIAWFIFLKNKKDLKLLTLLLFSTVFIVVSSFLPFFPRYLLPLSFVFVYLIIYVFRNKLAVSLLICLISYFSFFNSFRLSPPQGDALAAARFIETRADRELYRSISPEILKNMSEKDFINTVETFNETIDTRKIQVTVGEGTKNSGKYYYDFNIKYFTKEGIVENNVPFIYENINNQWKLDWSWDYLYKEYTPGSKIEFVNPLVAPSKVYEVFIIPRLMYDWNKNLNNLLRLTGIGTQDINKNLTSVVPNDFPKFVGYLSSDISAKERDELIKDKGVIRIKEIYINRSLENEPNSLKFE